MALSPGTRLGTYEIQSLLGAGGMGEVYRAVDAHLGRQVAIKVLPAALADDPDRLARFEREARVLASLNHPHIAAIYGVERIPSSGSGRDQHALVLELVDGVTLADRLRSGPIAPAEAQALARQIADALDAAHEKGIVHRDLKPENIKMTVEGAAKVLDFGLAKATAESAAADLTHSPTTLGPTATGILLGTAPYMSPEQTRGRPVDRRTDIWAFGCVLFEMLTGRRAFGGETVSDTIAAILEREPDWTALPASTPPSLARLLQQCLEKDVRRRLRDIGDARFDPEQTAVGTVSPSSATAQGVRGREWLAWSSAGVLALGCGAFLFRQPVTSTAALVSRTTIVLPAGQQLEAGASSAYPIAVSPDGARLAYVANVEGRLQLYLREMDEQEPRAVAGAAGAMHPFFSPDGQWVAFFAGGALQKVAIAGGAPLRICDVSALSLGGAWAPDNTIVFALRGTGLYTVDAAGGAAQPLAPAPADWPDILPDGKTVVFSTGASGSGGSAIAVMPLAGGARRVVARTNGSQLDGPAVLGTGDIAQARYLPSGHLVYGQSPGNIRAVPFDVVSLSLRGSPVSLVDPVLRGLGGGAVYFAVSQTGLLVYAPTGDRHQLVWVDRAGTATPISADREAFRMPRLSPDGTRVAVGINNDTRRSDIWVYDTRRGTRNRLTTAGHNLEPVWTPDGTRIIVGGLREFGVDGTGGQSLASGPVERYPTDWSPDGRTLLFHLTAAGGRDIWALTRGGSPHPLLERRFDDSDGQFSPDGRWIAWHSDETGRSEVYVARYPDLSDKVAISTAGGEAPKWARDGRELFYRQGDAMMAAAVDTMGRVSENSPLRVESPRRLFEGNYSGAGRDPQFDVSPDGRRFVMVKSDEASTLRQLTVVQNWLEELRVRVPTAP